MGEIGVLKKFSEIGTTPYLLYNYQFFNLKEKIDSKSNFKQVRLSDYFDVISGFAFSSKDYTNEGVKVCRISDIKKTGRIELEKMHTLPEDFIDKYSNYKILEGDILIGMTGDGVYFKTGIFNHHNTDVLLNQRVGILRLKKGVKDCSPKFVSLLFNLEEVQNQIRIVAMGKTQKNVSPFDIINVSIPKIKFELQNKIVEKTKPLELGIIDLENKLGSNLDIINSVFANSFKIDLAKVNEIDSKNIFQLSLNEIVFRNSNFRNSSRWFKVQKIQEYLYKDIDCIHKLGTYITKTKNGWSPNSQEGGDGTPILGQEHFNPNINLGISPNKTTIETRNNIEDFYIKKGDFFVSRGNTIDLVALASIVNEDIAEDILYPDLYIKIEFDTKKIDEEYLAYLFNSFFGRYYFKYVSKGKNQTMVKISAIELDNFYIPIPDKNKQLEIVKNIKTQIDAQKIIDKQIAKKQEEISDIIEKAIQNE